MLYASNRLKKDAIRVIKLNIYHPSSLIFICFRRVVKLLSNLFTKTFSITILKKLIRIHQLKDLHANLLENI